MHADAAPQQGFQALDGICGIPPVYENDCQPRCFDHLIFPPLINLFGPVGASGQCARLRLQPIASSDSTCSIDAAKQNGCIGAGQLLTERDARLWDRTGILTYRV
jgi:hypothetical protein